MDSLYNFFSSPFIRAFLAMFQIFIIVFWLALVGWTYKDAYRRGGSALYWATVVLFFNIFGWIVYLMLRPAEYLDDVRERDLEIKARQAQLRNSLLNCPACHKPVESDFLICPFCRKKLKEPCNNCKKPLNLSWTICPYCKSKA